MAEYVEHNKRIVKNTAALYLRSLLLLFINLYTSRVTLQVLGVDDFGIYTIVGGVVAMFSMLSSTMREASQRFITYSLGTNDSNEVKKVFSTCLSLHIVLALIVAVILEVVGLWFLNSKMNIPPDRLQTAGWVMQFSILTFVVNVISVPYNALIVAHERMSAFAYMSILEGGLKLGIVFFLMIISWDKLFVYAILQLVVAIIIRSVYTVYCKKSFKESNTIRFGINGPLFREMFAFAGWNLFGSGSMVLRNQGIDILLNLFFGVAVNAAKGISNQVQNTVHQFVGNFTASIYPQLTKSMAHKDYSRARSLVTHGGKISFFMMMLFAVPFIICAQEILEIWLVEVPEFAVVMVKLSFVYLLSDTLSRLLINSILAYGNIRNFQVIGGGIKLFALPIAYVVLKLGGSPLTGIWVNIFLDFICLGVRLYFAHARYHLDVKVYLTKVVLRCWGVFFLSMVIPSFFYYRISSSLFISGPIAVVSASFMIWFLGLDINEKKTLKDYLGKLFIK